VYFNLEKRSAQKLTQCEHPRGIDLHTPPMPQCADFDIGALWQGYGPQFGPQYWRLNQANLQSSSLKLQTRFLKARGLTGRCLQQWPVPDHIEMLRQRPSFQSVHQRCVVGNETHRNRERSSCRSAVSPSCNASTTLCARAYHSAFCALFRKIHRGRSASSPAWNKIPPQESLS